MKKLVLLLIAGTACTTLKYLDLSIVDSRITGAREIAGKMKIIHFITVSKEVVELKIHYYYQAKKTMSDYSSTIIIPKKLRKKANKFISVSDIFMINKFTGNLLVVIVASNTSKPGFGYAKTREGIIDLDKVYKRFIKSDSTDVITYLKK